MDPGGELGSEVGLQTAKGRVGGADGSDGLDHALGRLEGGVDGRGDSEGVTARGRDVEDLRVRRPDDREARGRGGELGEGLARERCLHVHDKVVQCQRSDSPRSHSDSSLLHANNVEHRLHSSRAVIIDVHWLTAAGAVRCHELAVFLHLLLDAAEPLAPVHNGICRIGGGDLPGTAVSALVAGVEVEVCLYVVRLELPGTLGEAESTAANESIDGEANSLLEKEIVRRHEEILASDRWTEGNRLEEGEVVSPETRVRQPGLQLSLGVEGMRTGVDERRVLAVRQGRCRQVFRRRVEEAGLEVGTDKTGENGGAC
mmetsp:Transcript_6272/g.25320  ORF Transcript_6272/g.25320 Transcript_6272/m.25320 type:complete len:315 (-) Transcript_6272:1313-2257(-)